MPIFDIFSKRRARGEGRAPDVYQYDNLPVALRIQIAHIWVSTIGNYFVNSTAASNQAWDYIENTVAREHGVESLAPKVGNARGKCLDFLRKAKTSDVLDIVEVSFRTIDEMYIDRGDRESCGITQDADDAIVELNHRFKEHRVGYRYENEQLLRIDSDFTHEEIVKPALSLLQSAGFAGAQEEFLSAHAHYRKGETKEAINDALKAFESTMKSICALRGWTYDKRATAKDLIKVMFDNGLVPAPLQTQFSTLRGVLESGLPTVRNKRSGHGQGSEPDPVPEYLASYALHLAASNIVFLVESHKSMR